MKYQDALSRKHDDNDVVALYFNGKDISYECVRIGNRSQIDSLLPGTDGQAFGYMETGRRYWVLTGKEGMLMWSQTGSYPPFGDISSDAKDYRLFRYLVGMR